MLVKTLLSQRKNADKIEFRMTDDTGIVWRCFASQKELKQNAYKIPLMECTVDPLNKDHSLSSDQNVCVYIKDPDELGFASKCDDNQLSLADLVYKFKDDSSTVVSLKRFSHNGGWWDCATLFTISELKSLLETTYYLASTEVSAWDVSDLGTVQISINTANMTSEVSKFKTYEQYYTVEENTETIYGDENALAAKDLWKPIVVFPAGVVASIAFGLFAPVVKSVLIFLAVLLGMDLAGVLLDFGKKKEDATDRKELE